MAQIVFGMAVPHSGMLGQAPEDWLTNGERDRKNPELWYQGRTWTYPELEAHRGAAFEPFLTLEERTTRAGRCRAALDEMKAAYERANVDVAIILGKDQKEIFIDNNPSMSIYTGAKIENGPPQRSVYGPDSRVVYDAHPGLAMHITQALQAEGFDLNQIVNWPPNVWMQNEPIVPHAFGFIYHQIMGDQPPPNVPILLNTFYAPTQPSVRRSIAFGQALNRAIQAWDADTTVAIIASGGLSHFVCDEQLDQRFIDCFRSSDFEGLARIDERSYQSGNSEVKLYIPVMVAMSQLGCDMTLVDYVPCYRTEAGTGEGMGFMYWAPR